MKQQDIAMIIVIVFLSGLVAFFVSGKVISSSTKRSQMVEVVPTINPNFQQPDSKYFNSKSIDPTQTIQIGTNANQTPFGQSTGQ